MIIDCILTFRYPVKLLNTIKQIYNRHCPTNDINALALLRIELLLFYWKSTDHDPPPDD